MELTKKNRKYFLFGLLEGLIFGILITAVVVREILK